MAPWYQGVVMGAGFVPPPAIMAPTAICFHPAAGVAYVGCYGSPGSGLILVYNTLSLALVDIWNYSGTFQKGTLGVDGLTNPTELALDATGSRLFVTTDYGVAAFDNTGTVLNRAWAEPVSPGLWLGDGYNLMVDRTLNNLWSMSGGGLPAHGVNPSVYVGSAASIVSPGSRTWFNVSEDQGLPGVVNGMVTMNFSSVGVLVATPNDAAGATVMALDPATVLGTERTDISGSRPISGMIRNCATLGSAAAFADVGVGTLWHWDLGGTTLQPNIGPPLGLSNPVTRVIGDDNSGAFYCLTDMDSPHPVGTAQALRVNSFVDNVDWVTTLTGPGGFGGIFEGDIAVDPSSGLLWASSTSRGSISIIDPTSGSIVHTIT